MSLFFVVSFSVTVVFFCNVSEKKYPKQIHIYMYIYTYWSVQTLTSELLLFPTTEQKPIHSDWNAPGQRSYPALDCYMTTGMFSFLKKKQKPHSSQCVCFRHHGIIGCLQSVVYTQVSSAYTHIHPAGMFKEILTLQYCNALVYLCFWLLCPDCCWADSSDHCASVETVTALICQKASFSVLS